MAGWTPVHHPFTRPRTEDEALSSESPGDALAIAYDVVLNGTEIGGGSLRIHERELQQKVFGVLGLGEEEARSQFGFLLEAFRFGPPPHGGIAIRLGSAVHARRRPPVRSVTSSPSPRPPAAAIRSPALRPPSPPLSARKPASTSCHQSNKDNAAMIMG